MVEISWGKYGVTRRFSGHVTADEMAGSAIAVQADERFDLLRWVINDFTACLSTDVSKEDLRIMLAKAGASIENLRGREFRAAFVGNIPHLREVIETPMNARLFGQPLRWFETLDEALAFVQLPGR